MWMFLFDFADQKNEHDMTKKEYGREKESNSEKV